MSTATTIGIVGTSGGLGCTSLVVALSLHAARQGHRTACIDARPWGGGIEVTWGAEHLPGTRWPHLYELRGTPDAEAIAASLPRPSGVAVLSHSTAPWPTREEDLAAMAPAVGSAVVERHHVTVIDLPPPGAPLSTSWYQQCTSLLVMVAADAAGVCAAAPVLEWLHEHVTAPRYGVLRLRRRGGPTMDALSASLSVPFIGTVPHDPTVPRQIASGVAPGGRGRLSRSAHTIWDKLNTPIAQAEVQKPSLVMTEAGAAS